MSGRLVSTVFDSALPAWLKPYAAACATFAADDGSRVYPSIALIAKMVGRKERATQTAIHELRRRGVLVVEQEATRYRATRYRFNTAALPRLQDEAQLPLFPQAPLARSGANSSRGASFPQGSTGTNSHGCSGLRPWVQSTAPDPSGDPLRTNQRTARGRARDMGEYQKNGTRH